MARDNEKLAISSTHSRAGSLIKLSGVIDETFNKNQFIEGARGIVVVDLDGVRRITSYGVRDWIQALKALQFDYLGFINCRPAIVSQFNMVSKFGAGGQLVSFFAPFVCPGCGTDVEVLIDLRKQHAEVKAFTLPSTKCPSCGQDAEFDDVPEAYLAYSASAALPTPPPMFDAIVSGSVGQANTVPFKVEKEVRGDVTALWMSGDIGKTASFKRLGDGLEGVVLLLTEGIEEVTPEGLARFKQLLDSTEFTTFLARVPARLAAAFGANPSALGRAKLVSLRLPFRCAGCDRVGPVDTEQAMLAELKVGRKPVVVCQECGGQRGPELLDPAWSAAVALSLEPAPLEVAVYLQSFPTFPEPGEPQATSESGASFGRYKLLRPLGAGGMAEVFLAQQTGLGGFEKQVVVKRILPNLSRDESFIAMFLQEARVAARISHPNVVQIFDVGRVGDRYFIAMEYVRGWDLNNLLRLAEAINFQMPVGLAARLVADICAGLHAAHSYVDENGNANPIIHRDVSPHNVLVSHDGRVKLTDFGIAKVADSSSRTPTATLKGKLSYVAPEQIQNASAPLDARTDVFPTAVMLYQCLTFQHIFRRETEFATLRAILQDPVPSILERRSDVPKKLEASLLKALARNPSERYATAKAFQQDLEDCIAEMGQPVSQAEMEQWTRHLIERGQVSGRLPSEMIATPTLSGASAITHPEVTPSGSKDVEPTAAIPLNKGGG